MCSLTIECVPSRYNVFSLRQESRFCKRHLVLKNVFSYNRMCSLTIQCVLFTTGESLLQAALGAGKKSAFLQGRCPALLSAAGFFSFFCIFLYSQHSYMAGACVFACMYLCICMHVCVCAKMVSMAFVNMSYIYVPNMSLMSLICPVYMSLICPIYMSLICPIYMSLTRP